MVDRIFQALFKFLLAVTGLLLFCQTMIQSHGQFAFAVLLILAVIVCLKLRRWSARIAAVIFIFFLFPQLVGHIARNTDPFTCFVILALMSIGAYFIREHRLQRKPAPAKAQGSERTPVFPPDKERV